MARTKTIETPKQIEDRYRLALQIKLMRTSLGLGQRELAKMVGLSFSAIAKVEPGKLRLKPKNISEILALFEQAGLIIKSTRQGMDVFIPSQTMHTLFENDFVWPFEETEGDA